MPLYPGIAGATVSAPSNISPVYLDKGSSHYVFGKLSTTATQLPVIDSNVTAEAIVAGQASMAVTLAPGAQGDAAPSVAVEVRFSAAPGTFELDIQEADTDADAFYITPTNTTYQISAVNATTFIARADLSPTGGKFMRVFMKTLTNVVNTTCKITRLG